MNCGAMVALLKEQPNRYVAALEERIRAAGGHPWGVELAAGFSRDSALSLYSRTLTRLADVAADHDPIISSQRSAQPRYAAVLPGQHRRRYAAGGDCLVRENTRRRRRMYRAAQWLVTSGRANPALAVEPNQSCRGCDNQI